MHLEYLTFIVIAGPDAPHNISSIVLNGDEVWVAAGPYLIQYVRGKEVSHYDEPKVPALTLVFKTLRFENPLEANLGSILAFGPMILALTEEGDRLLWWDLSGSGELPHQLPSLVLMLV